MEFDLHRWQREPSSRWLVKLVNEHVHAGTIHAFNDAGVVVNSTTGNIHLKPSQVEWIRPLIEGGADGWHVVAGFQAEDSTFDTWWMSGNILVCINYSAPTGFSDLLQVISPHDRAAGRTPTREALAQVRSQIHRILIERRGEAVSPIAHLQ